jgi:hypothetical protein
MVREKKRRERKQNKNISRVFLPCQILPHVPSVCVFISCMPRNIPSRLVESRARYERTTAQVVIAQSSTNPSIQNLKSHR